MLDDGDEDGDLDKEALCDARVLREGDAVADIDSVGDDDGRGEPDMRAVTELRDDAEGEGDAELAPEAEKVSAGLKESKPVLVAVVEALPHGVSDATSDAVAKTDRVGGSERKAEEVGDTDGDGIVDSVEWAVNETRDERDADTLPD